MRIPLQLLALAFFLIIDKRNLDRSIFKKSFMYVLFDSFMHLTYFMITAMPFVRHPFVFAAGCALSVLFDIDHVIEARSISPSKLLNLGRRPFSHSLTFIIPLSLLVLLASRSLLLAYVIFFSASSHILRDLTEGITYPFYPSKRFASVDYPLFAAASFALAILNIFIAKYI